MRGGTSHRDVAKDKRIARWCCGRKALRIGELKNEN